MKKDLSKRVISIVQYNSRLIATKLDIKPVNTFITQVYMSTSNHGDDEIEEMHEQIDEVIKLSRGNNHLVFIEIKMRL